MIMNYSTNSIFVGITSWNSQLFLPHCLRSLIETTKGQNVSICVLDNNSTDDSVAIAQAFGVEVIQMGCTQPQALSFLINHSKADYTLLIHSDVILVDPRWPLLCMDKIEGKVVLVSPEDIGCGPMTRPFGINKPESSFMFFNTKLIKKCRKIIMRPSRNRIFPQYEFDFNGSHVTHNIPAILSRHGYRWFAMNVLTSNFVSEPLFRPTKPPAVWSDELMYLRYGLGNFYSIDGIITHYHNWYDRISTRPHSEFNTANSKKDFPADYIKDYTSRFLSDYQKNNLDLPIDLNTRRPPKAL
jgi:glycosyltransferase involved in cell wall biosynthesis